MVAVESLDADLLERGEVFADAVVVVDPALGLLGLVFVGSVVGVGAVVGRPPARRSLCGRGGEQRSTSKPSPAAPVCAYATGFRRRTSKPPSAAAVCAFGALALDQHELHELRATSCARAPSRTAQATKRTAKRARGPLRQLVANPNRVHGRRFGVLSISSPPDEPKTATTAAFWVAHHADPSRTPPPASPPARQPASPRGRWPPTATPSVRPKREHRRRSNVKTSE